MDRMLRFVLVIIGVLLGVSFGAPDNRFLGAVLGALAALGVAEFTDLRSRVHSLQSDVERLKKARRQPAESDATLPSEYLEPAVPMVVAARTVPHSDSASTPPPLPSASPSPSSSAAERMSRFPPLLAVVRFFVSGNTVVRAGVVILFFGVAFLLRYMAEHTHVPVEARLTGIALASIALSILGWRLRTRRPGYALALQGGGIGIVYLTVFAALRLYGLLPAAAAFPLLAATAASSAILAVKQDSMSLATLGVTGGFVAPVLASTGDGSHEVLFSYYALLNAGILAMAWFKAWRPLNLVGFVFTFAIGTGWGVLRYRSDEFASTEPFLILFFLFYLAIAILFSARRSRLEGFVDGTLVFGTPIVVFALQTSLLRDRLLSLAFSAVAMSSVYLASAGILQRRKGLVPALMVDAFLAIGIAFLTLAIPLALDARWNAASWTLEGAALVWVGCRQHLALARMSGSLLILVAECMTTFNLHLSAAPFFLAWQAYFDVLLQSAAAIFAALTLNAYRIRLLSREQAVPRVLFWLGLFAWFSAGVGEIYAHWPDVGVSGTLLLGTLTALGCSGLHRMTIFDDARVAALLLLPLMIALAVFSAGHLAHPFAQSGWLGWPVAFAGLGLAMYRHEGPPDDRVAAFLQTCAAWLFCGLCSWELVWAVDPAIAGARAWPMAAWAVVPALFLLALPRLVTRVDWPFVKNHDAYAFTTAAGLAGFLCAWSAWTSVTSTGDSSPLPYVPMLNPQDVAQAAVLFVLAYYWRFARTALGSRDSGVRFRLDPRLPAPVLGLLGFAWLTAALLRTLQNSFGVSSDLSLALESTLVQTSLSIFWAILAFATMLIAARLRKRGPWIIGAALLGIVIAKLFLVDLSRIGSIERIVSFVAVGLILLVVGYISPLPPSEETSP